MRPVGGALADRFGGSRMLAILYGLVATLLLGVATLPSLWLATTLFTAAMALLGAGNGCVFQLVPLRFQRQLGVVTGLVGAAGGLGGFFLPSLLGLLRDHTGTYASGLVLLAFACVWGLTLVVAVSGTWRLTWATAPRGFPSQLTEGSRG
jgi:NNP family nitrate/nitrite transporter-like MFS transporter